MDEQNWLTISAATLEEAELIGLARLGALREEVEVEVIDEGKKGFLGLGGRPAEIRIRRLVPMMSSASASSGQAGLTPSSVAAAAPSAVAPSSAPAGDETPSAAKPAARRETPSAGEGVAETSPAPDLTAALSVLGAPEGEELATAVDSVAAESFILEEAKQLLAGFRVHVSLGPAADGSGALVLSIRGRDARSLVGRDAHVMEAVQHLLRLLLQRRMPGGAPEVIVDADGYWERHDRKLRQLAQRTADEVARTGRAVRMRPMPARDRRVIHITLRNDPRVSTESQGAGAQRAVVVSPRSKA